MLLHTPVQLPAGTDELDLVGFMRSVSGASDLDILERYEVGSMSQRNVCFGAYNPPHWGSLNQVDSESCCNLVGGEVKTNKLIAVVICVFAILMCCSVMFAQKAPDTVVLKGAPMGGVKFDHKAHVATGTKCIVCHHASKPEKPSKAAQENCMDCHTKTATPPMKTKTQAAFHNPTATAGLCIDCHKKEVAAGKKAPTKCAECHQKANV
jgi:hypothetical protein